MLVHDCLLGVKANFKVYDIIILACMGVLHISFEGIDPVIRNLILSL